MRRLIGILIAVALIASLVALVVLLTPGDGVLDYAHGSAAAGAAQRRLILICFDTVRYDSFWLPGKTRLPDAFAGWAKKAMRFTRVQSAAPWTNPSVATVMTGLYPIQHGAGSFTAPVANLDDQVPSPLGADIPTLAGRFVDLGVPTRAVVAHPWFKPKLGLGNGFPHIDFRDDGEAIVDTAEGWLGKVLAASRDSSYFLYLHFMEAHDEHMVSKEELEEMLTAIPTVLRELAVRTAPGDVCRSSEGILCKRYQVYVNAIAEERAFLTRILDFLASGQLIKSTTVVLYSDHGEEFRGHYQTEKDFGIDPRGFYGVGHGHSLYQTLLHVPVLVWRPRERGREVRTETSLAALPHLLSRWFGLSLPAGPGIDPMQALDGRAATQPLFSSGIAYGPPGFAVELGRWKLIQFPTRGISLLFDLATDPDEKTPVDDPEIERSLAGLIAEYRALPGHEASPPPQLDARELERLKALGYLTDVSGAR